MSLLLEPSNLFFILLLACFLSALLHSSVGLGGGSSYTAWMIILGLPVLVIPPVALSLNVMVSGISSVQFLRHGYIPWKVLAAILVCSIPAAYIGGGLSVDTKTIYILLLISLIVVFIRLMFFHKPLANNVKPEYSLPSMLIVAGLGGLLGLLSGLIGIGGGIYLVPMLVLLKILDIKQAAACGAVFIFCNSIAGLIAKWQSDAIDFSFVQIMPLLVVVAVGGFLGSRFAIKHQNTQSLYKILAAVVFVACVLLLKRIFIIEF